MQKRIDVLVKGILGESGEHLKTQIMDFLYQRQFGADPRGWTMTSSVTSHFPDSGRGVVVTALEELEEEGKVISAEARDSRIWRRTRYA